MPVTIVMIEDDEGHARLIEKNIRRAGVNNEILTFVGRGTSARDYNRLKASFDRLQSTTVLTSIRQLAERYATPLPRLW